MKKFVSAALCAAILSASAINAAAYTYPRAIWKVNPVLEAAVNSGDNAGIAAAATQVVNIMWNEQDCDEVRNTIVGKLRMAGLAYAAMNDYDSAAATFERLYNYAVRFGDQFYDDVRMAKERMRQYKSELVMYTEGGSAPYYWAKNEKQNGILFGLCEDGETRAELPNESMVLVYQELGSSVLPYHENVIKKASEAGVAVEYALNCPGEGSDIASIYSFEWNLQQVADMLAKYPDVPVFLRFGAEFDVWSTPTEPQAFVNAFRYVSDFFESRVPQVAMVWSPNSVSSWNVDVNDFYPGDEYVDWVGVSLYANRYFSTEQSENDNNEIAFHTGVNANPVLVIKDLVETYGDRKPIMISESGCEHYYGDKGEDTTWWAYYRMKQYYGYLPMVYPQIKLMGYFDHYNRSSDRHTYSLHSNEVLKNEYLKLTSGQRFLQYGYNDETGFCYSEVWNGYNVNSVFMVSSYAHIYKQEIDSVTYYIDGNYAAQSNELPFTAYIDASAYGGGAHTLTAVAAGTDGTTVTSERTVNIKASSFDGISVRISGETVDFDQKPVIYNDRTMVPLRAIFEKLGASVSWDNETKTVTGQRGATTVKITVGSNAMFVNGERRKLDASAIVLSDRTLVPARAVAESFGCTVGWDDATAAVIIEE